MCIDFRLACGPFERLETAGSRMQQLLREVIKTAVLAVPHSPSEESLLASLILVSEIERRVALLERAAKSNTNPHRPADTPEQTEDTWGLEE